MKLNYNPATGIPYGVIYLNELNADVADDLFYNGENVSEKETLEELREQIASQMREDEEEGYCGVRSLDRFNDELDRRVEREIERLCIDEPTIEGESDGVKYMISWLGGAPLLWVLHSNYTGTYTPCSPCVPGAGDLSTPDEYGVQCYDVPAEWR